MATAITTQRSRMLAPVRYTAWLSGDLGRELQETVQGALLHVQGIQVTKLQRGFLIEADEDPGVLLEACAAAMMVLEKDVEKAYPVFHEEIGPVWTGTVQAVFASS